MMASPLGDAPSFVARLERVYRILWRNHCRGAWAGQGAGKAVGNGGGGGGGAGNGMAADGERMATDNGMTDGSPGSGSPAHM